MAVDNLMAIQVSMPCGRSTFRHSCEML